MKKLIVLLLLASPILAFAQPPVKYVISFPNAVHHEAELTVTFADLPAGTLELRMSRSSPGRYALHEFAKNVYNVRAKDGSGNSLAIRRPNPYQWDVAGHNGTVTVTYTLFADRADGTYSGIDETHAHLNMPATFMWARGLQKRPIEVTFAVPAKTGWRVATQLAPSGDPHRFTAPDMDYFMDSPTEVSANDLRSWQVQSAGRTYTFRLALHHAGTDAEAEAYTEMAKRVVYEEEGIFGELPAFDYGTYTFLADYLPYVSGDGMEHRNSTVLIGTRPLKTGAVRNLGTLVHEFVHCWNVERIRPRALEPFDFERANMCGELWFAEGFTSYYTPLTLRRAGLISLDRFAGMISNNVDYVIRAPGRQFFNAVEMSKQAPFVDAATAIDPTNRENTFISYYTYGFAIGLGLDLSLCARADTLSLDRLMQAMWRKYGKTATPYTNEDIRRTLGEITGDAAFADAFFARYIYGHEVVDYRTLLARAGFALRKRAPGKPSLGPVRLRDDGGEMRLAGATRIGTPLYAAGLDRGDLLLALDGRNISSRADYEAVLAAHEPGDTLAISFEQRGRKKRKQVQVIEDPRLEIVPFEHAGRPLTAEVRAFRARWLGSKAITRLPALHKYCPRCKRAFAFEDEFCRYDGEKLQMIKPKG